MQFWSDNFQFEDSSVSIPEGTAEVNVTGAGQNLSGVSIYAFNSAGAYLGLTASTDADGMTSFRLPAGGVPFSGRLSEQPILVRGPCPATRPEQCGGNILRGR